MFSVTMRGAEEHSIIGKLAATLLTGVALLALATSANAACPGTVGAGTTITTPQIIDSNERCVVESSGAIDVSSFADAVRMRGTNPQLENYGNISQSATLGGWWLDAVWVEPTATNAHVKNWGNISATIGYGVHLDGTNNVLENFGTISSAWESLYLDGHGLEVFNYGSLPDGVEIDDAIDLLFINKGNIGGKVFFGEDVDDNTFINYGTLSTTSNAIETEDDLDGIVNIHNYGLIHSTSGNAIFIDDDVDNGFAIYIYNMRGGRIISDSDDAIHMDRPDYHAAPFQIYNAGLISAPLTAHAIRFNDADNLLVLLPGSVLQGMIDLDGSTEVHLNSGMSTVFAVHDTLAGSTFFSTLPMFIDNANNRVITVNPGELGSAVTGLDILAIANGLRQSLPAAASGDLPEAVSVRPTSGTIVDEIAVFAGGFGGMQKITFGGLEAKHTAAGGLLGVQWRFVDVWNVGLFAGAATGSSRTRNFAGTSFSSKVRDVFGGAYASYADDMMHVRLAGFLGHNSSSDVKRTVLYNLVLGGLQTVAASLSNTFIAGQLTAGMTMPVEKLENGILSIRPEMQLTAGHAWGDYSDKSGVVPVSADHSTNVLQGRLQMGLLWQQQQQMETTMFGLRGGLQVDRISARTSIKPSGLASRSDTLRKTQLTAFAGAEARVEHRDGFAVMVNGDVQFGKGGVRGLTAGMGVRILLGQP